MADGKARGSSKLNYLYMISAPLAGALMFLIAFRAVSPTEYADSDFFTFWLAGRLVSAGQNPYVSEVWLAGHQQFGAAWIPNLTFIYPLPVGILFVPVASMPLYPAFLTWVIASEVMILAAIVLLLRARSFPGAGRFALPILAGVLLFRPLVITLHNGQLSALLLLVASAIAYFWERSAWKTGALLLPLLAIKPNIGGPLIVLLCLYLLLRRQVRPILLGAAAGCLLVALGWLWDADWISEFLNAGQTKLALDFGYSPTFWGVSSYLCNHEGGCSLGFGAGGTLVALLGYIWFVVRRRGTLSPLWALSLAVIVTLVITPYTWPYDQLLLIIPILGVLREADRRGLPFLASALLFIGIDILALVLLWVTGRIQTEIWNAAVPLTVLALTVWAVPREPTASPTAVADSARPTS